LYCIWLAIGIHVMQTWSDFSKILEIFILK
jgi:hypothetical protein